MAVQVRTIPPPCLGIVGEMAVSELSEGAKHGTTTKYNGDGSTNRVL